MSCGHCVFDCKKRGKSMSLETFKNAVEFNKEYIVSEYIFIGGGEPTLNKYIEQMIFEVMAAGCMCSMVSNGTNTKVLERLHNIMKLTDEKALSIRISNDRFHDYDMVDDEIWKLFKPKFTDYERKNSGTNIIINQGRAKKNKLGTTEDCACNGPFIKPDGGLYICGCNESMEIGNVNDKNSLEHAYQILCDHTESNCYSKPNEHEIL